MKLIQKLADHIEDELHGAKCYAEKYLEAKAFKNQEAAQYREMAGDELRHAEILHNIAVAKVQTLGAVYTAPAEMQEKWDRLHREYTEKYAWVKQMLSM